MESRQPDGAGLKVALLENVSHELRTPLNGIIGFSELLADEVMGPLCGEQKDALDHILSSARRLLKMIEGVVDLADASAGSSPLRPETVVVEELLRRILQAHGAAALEKRLRLAVAVDPAVEHVVLDAERLAQVLDCLVSNAVKFTPDEGRVGLHASEEGAALRIEVRDTGIGIAPGDHGRLFVAFEQLDHGIAKRHAGVGLGLALVKRTVDRMGGRVSVTSEPGQGSTFVVVLPFERP